MSGRKEMFTLCFFPLVGDTRSLLDAVKCQLYIQLSGREGEGGGKDKRGKKGGGKGRKESGCEMNGRREEKRES